MLTLIKLMWSWFIRNYKSSGLPASEMIPDSVGTCLVHELKLDPDYVWKLKTVRRPWPNQSKIYHFRVYDEFEAEKQGVKVVDYNSLNDHPRLILYQGVCDSQFFKVCIKGFHEKPQLETQTSAQFSDVKEIQVGVPVK